ncbi:MAG: tyrosine-type recombinase/integrase [Lachnospiraceae bacterium]
MARTYEGYSIIKRGNNYTIFVSDGNKADGSQNRHTATFKPPVELKTEKQRLKTAKVFAFNFEQSIRNGTYLNGEKITFKEFYDKWIVEYAEKRLESKTVATYRHLATIHIIPEIGNLKLAKVQPRRLNSLYNFLLEQRKDGKPGGYSQKTVEHIHELISSIMGTALKWNIISQNPCTRVSPTRQSNYKDKLKYFTVEQAISFLQMIERPYYIAIKAHARVDDTGKPYKVAEYKEKHTLPLQMQLLFKLAIHTGMRRGELVALEWSDIDFDECTIDITKSAALVNGVQFVKVTKTKGSVRLLAVPGNIIALAREVRTEQRELRISLGSAWEGENNVFIQKSGKQMYLDTPYRTFRKMLLIYNSNCKSEADKLPLIPFHGLRHTSATIMLTENVDVRTVAGRLGHNRSSTTTDIYGHFLQRADQRASLVLEKALSQNVQQMCNNAKK